MSVGIDQHLFQASAYGNVFEEAGQHRLAFFANRGRDDHAIRLDAPQLTRLEIGDDHNLHANDLLRRILLGDSGDNRAYLSADINFELEQLIGAFNLFRRLHLSNTKFHFGKIVDGDAAVSGTARSATRPSGFRGALDRSGAGSCGGLGCNNRSDSGLRSRLSGFGACSCRSRGYASVVGSGLLQILHSLHRVLLGAWKYRLHLAQLRAQLKLTPFKLVKPAASNIAQTKLRPDARGCDGQYWMQESGNDAQRLCAGIEHGRKTGKTGLVFLLAELPRLVFDDIFVYAADQ